MAPKPTGILEEPFRRQIRDLAALYGWTYRYHTHNSQRSDAGWPDEVFLHPLNLRIIFAELKTDTGKPTPAQTGWLTHLNNCGLETALWRPRDLDTIIAVLGPQQQRTRADLDQQPTHPRNQDTTRPKPAVDFNQWRRST
jgi:hypothetical protein